jgi:SAM-dependent methyltransferase
MVAATASGHWPHDALETVDRCPVCGGGRRAVLYQDLEDRVSFCAPGRWTLYRCGRCDSGYLDPRPTCETIGRAYAGYHTHGAPPEPAGADGMIGRLRRMVRNGYLNARYHVDLKPAPRLGGPVLALLPWLRQDRAVRHLPLPERGSRLLDVGCGNGAFVRHALALGWDAEGLDPDPDAVAAGGGPGARVTTGSLPQTRYPDGAFAAVTLDHTIEHLHAPIDALREVFRLLRPGGSIWIATPNLDSIGHKLFARNWRGLEPPRHLVLFTATALHAALAETGYEQIEQRRSPFVSRWWFTASQRIAAGEDPLAEQGLPLPLRSRLRARLADWRGFAAPARSEEIIFTAHRPLSRRA